MIGLPLAKDPEQHENLLTLVAFHRRSEAEKARQASEAQALRREPSFSGFATGNTQQPRPAEDSATSVAWSSPGREWRSDPEVSTEVDAYQNRD